MKIFISPSSFIFLMCRDSAAALRRNSARTIGRCQISSDKKCTVDKNFKDFSRKFSVLSEKFATKILQKFRSEYFQKFLENLCYTGGNLAAPEWSYVVLPWHKIVARGVTADRSGGNQASFSFNFPSLFSRFLCLRDYHTHQHQLRQKEAGKSEKKGIRNGPTPRIQLPNG